MQIVPDVLLVAAAAIGRAASGWAAAVVLRATRPRDAAMAPAVITAAAAPAPFG